MDYNKNIDLQVTLDYVNEEIINKSKTWASKLVDKIHLEANAPIVIFADETLKNYERVLNIISGKDQKKVNKLLPRLSEQEKKDYEKVAKQKQDEKVLEDSIDGMRKLEDFLDVIVPLRDELKSKIK